MFVMITMMMTMMYFYCEKEISEYSYRSGSYRRKVKGGEVFEQRNVAWLQSFSIDGQVTVTAVSTVELEWVKCAQFEIRIMNILSFRSNPGNPVMGSSVGLAGGSRKSSHLKETEVPFQSVLDALLAVSRDIILLIFSITK